MKLKSWILIAGLAICIIVTSFSLNLNANCCAWEEDCCCTDMGEWGLVLEEYLCVCSKSGGPLIFRECIYREIYWPPTTGIN